MKLLKNSLWAATIILLPTATVALVVAIVYVWVIWFDWIIQSLFQTDINNWLLVFLVLFMMRVDRYSIIAIALSLGILILL